MRPCPSSRSQFLLGPFALALALAVHQGLDCRGQARLAQGMGLHRCPHQHPQGTVSQMKKELVWSVAPKVQLEAPWD